VRGAGVGAPAIVTIGMWRGPIVARWETLGYGPGSVLLSQPAQSVASSVAPSQTARELAMDLRVALDGLITHLARLGALSFDVMISAQPF
jgi:hypothetical protein